MNVLHVSFEDIINCQDNSTKSLTNEVIIYENEFLIREKIVNYANIPPLRIEAVTFFLCESGEISFSVNYKAYRLTKGMLMTLNHLHILENIHVSDNYKGHALIASENILLPIINEIPIPKKLAMTTNHFQPLLKLDEEDMKHITDIISRIKKGLKSSDHFFQSQIIKNEVSNFILDIANIQLKRMKTEESAGIYNKKNHKEDIIQNFIRLIFDHCKEQHEVSFYAKELCMTQGNLSRIMKAASGKTAIKWISDVIISESKILLHRPNINIQQISEILHFGDQSSFGKFFKKNTGYTPMEYRNNIQKNK